MSRTSDSGGKSPSSLSIVISSPICFMYGIFTYIWVFFTANVCNYSMEHMGHYKPAQGEPKGERFGFFCRRVSPHVFFRLPWAMDNSSHEYMEAQSGHGQCLKIWSTLSSLYTQNQIHQNSKHSKFQVPRFSVF